jgi:hypothetical protein
LGADFQIGAAESDWPRIADVVPPPPLPFDLQALGPDSPAVKTPPAEQQFLFDFVRNNANKYPLI